MKLGVFDSGIGGEAVAASLQKAFPHAKILAANDRANVPYGDKTREEIIRLTDTAIQPLLAEGCDIIVIACNSATTAAIGPLRSKYRQQKFIGIEPMIKPAAELTKSGIIAVCATPATLASPRYHALKEAYVAHLTVVEPDCSEWAHMIEHNQINHEKITATIDGLCEAGADTIVLGCTHYHWIKELVTKVADGRATVLEPSEAIGQRVSALLSIRP